MYLFIQRSTILLEIVNSFIFEKSLEQLYIVYQKFKNSHWVIIDCHTPVILQLGEDKILIYLIKTECWPNTSYSLI